MIKIDPKNSTSVLELQLESRWDEIIAAELILLLFIFVIALLGNGLIFVAFCQSTKLQTTQNVYIMSFAVVDILLAVFVAPFTVVVAAKGNWIFGETVCQFQGFVISVLIAVTILTMALTAVDRCFAMVSPEKYSKITTPYAVTGINALVWFLSLLVPSSYILDGQKFTFHPGYLFCKPNTEDKYVLASILAVIYFILPLVVIAGSYLEVKGRIETYHKNSKKKQNLSKNLGSKWCKNEEAARMFGAVTLAVLCFWVPFLLVEEIETFCGRFIMPRSIYVICSLLGFASFACKIFLYSTFNKDLKDEFHKAVKFRRSRRIGGTIQSENTKEMPDFISSSPQLARHTQIKRVVTNTDPDKQFDTEEDEDEDELQFDCRTPSPAFEHDSIKLAKRSKSRIDSGHFSETRTIPNTPYTPFETRPNSVVSIPKRTKSRKETVRFSDGRYRSCQFSQTELVASQTQNSFPRQTESSASRKALSFTQEQSSYPFQRESPAPRTRFIVPQTRTSTPSERVEIRPQKGNIVFDSRKSTPSIEKSTVSQKGINASQSRNSPLPHRNNILQNEEIASVSQTSSTTQEKSIHSLAYSTVAQTQRSTSPQKVKTSMKTGNTTYMETESSELESNELQKIEATSRESEITTSQIMNSALNEEQPESHEIGRISNTANLEHQETEKAGNSFAAASITSRDLPPVFPRKNNAKLNDNLWKSAARGRLTATEHLRKNNKQI